jgi:hypothetical protein
MAHKKKKTLEDYQSEGIELRDCEVDSCVLEHPDSLKGNSVDARIILSFKMPDGRLFTFNQVRRIRLAPDGE